jgi:sec-independent protein translocase protein TatA
MCNSILLFSLPGGMEWVLIFMVVLLLFGGRKIPELLKGIGKGIREFNDAKDKVKHDIEDGMKEDPKAEEKEKNLSDKNRDSKEQTK